MKLSQLSNRWLNRLYKSIAVLLVVFAVLISALRLFLPYAHHYRTDLQDYINTQYQTAIEIGALSMDWQQAGPVLVARNVSVVNTESVELFIEHVDIKVDFWKSLQLTRLVTSGFTLDGASIFIDKAMLASGGSSQQESDIIENIAELFLIQLNRFAMRNSQVIVRTETSDRKFSISHLKWSNQGNSHNASGAIIVDDLSSNNISLRLAIEGEELSELSGQAFLSGNQLDITPWLDKVLVVDDDHAHSDINFDAWLTLANGNATAVQVEIKESKIEWQIDEEQHAVTIAPGQILATMPKTDSILLASSLLEVSLDENNWQPFTFSAQHSSTQTYAYLSQLDIGGLSKLVPLFIEQPQLVTMLSDASPQGVLQNIHLRNALNTQQAWWQIADFSSQFSGGIPGISNLSADVVVDNNQLVATVLAENGELDFNKHFIHKIPYQKLSSSVALKWDEQGLVVKANDTQVSSEQLAVNAEVSVAIPTDDDASMALYANVLRGKAEFADYYYPQILMGDDLVKYLQQGIVKGDLISGQVLFNGNFADFPFHHNEGIFTVDADIANATFNFDNDWPNINELAANLNFTNNSMLITAHQGDLQGLDVKQVTVAIDDLTDEQLLVVKADINQQAPKNITTLMNDSPYQSSVGEALNQITIGGKVSGDFQLDLPLNNLNNAVASGNIDLAGNPVALKTPDMRFTDVYGRVSFENEIVYGEGLKLNWRGLPTSVSFNTQDQTNYYVADIALNASWQDSGWHQQIPDSLVKYGYGDVDWQGNLALNFHRDGGFSYRAKVNSELTNTQLDLPSPYQKNIGENIRVDADISGQSTQSTIKVTAGEQLSFYGVLDHEKVSFDLAHLVLGDEKMLLPMDGFHITTKLAQADVLQWHPFVQDILASLPEPSIDQEHLPLLTAPERIRGTVERLTMLGESLSHVSFDFMDQQAWWLLHLNAKEARSQIKFYPNWHQQGIDIQADFLHLVANNNEPATPADKQITEEADLSKSPEFDPELFAAIPPIRMQCDSCKIESLDLGNLSFEVKRQGENTITLNGLRAERGKTQLILDGLWTVQQGQSMTSITGELNINNIEREVEKFGYASIIKDSGYQGKLALSWAGGPHQFSLARLNGDIESELDDGYLADVSDKGARIFSVLSLQSLVRKLTLDFRDIFSDGMFYTYIKGDAHIKDGVLYTDNTEMKGAAGDLVVKGNTSLSAGTLDYRMSYKPNLTSSLPVLAWIATLNPVSFLAGVAINEVFTSTVVSEFNFELTGNVSEPTFKEVNRKSRDVSVGRSTPPQFVENNSKSPSSVQEPSQKNLTPPLPISDGDGSG